MKCGLVWRTRSTTVVSAFLKLKKMPRRTDDRVQDLLRTQVGRLVDSDALQCISWLVWGRPRGIPRVTVDSGLGWS